MAGILPLTLVFSSGAAGAVVIATPWILNSSYSKVNNVGSLTALRTDLHNVLVGDLLLEGIDAVVDDFLRNRAGSRLLFDHGGTTRLLCALNAALGELCPNLGRTTLKS
mgnify:CR=1 FL=1